jgi:hypothetical protein
MIDDEYSLLLTLSILLPEDLPRDYITFIDSSSFLYPTPLNVILLK